MINLDSLTTLSGIFAFLATMTALWLSRFAGGLLYFAAGAAGLGIIWDRWSTRAGHQTQVEALFSGQDPTAEEWSLLLSHLALLLAGLALVFAGRFNGGGLLTNQRERERECIAKARTSKCASSQSALAGHLPAFSSPCASHC